MKFGSWMIMPLVLCGLPGATWASWGNGLMNECKDAHVSPLQQTGWDCTGKKSSAVDDLKNTLSNAKIEKSGEGVKITFSEQLFFASGSSILNPGAKNELSNLARWLAKNKKARVRVEGHTDSVGEAELNQQLSDMRAEEVAGAISSSGVEKTRVQFLGYGEKRPVASNESQEGRQANRRVEIFIHN